MAVRSKICSCLVVFDLLLMHEANRTLHDEDNAIDILCKQLCMSGSYHLENAIVSNYHAFAIIAYHTANRTCTQP